MACVAKKEKPKRHQMTDAWKASVDAALKARDWTRADLARQLDVHKTVVSAMLGRQNVSALARVDFEPSSRSRGSSRE